MNNDDLPAWFILPVISAGVILFLWFGLMGLFTLTTEAECNRLGWRGSNVVWTLERYCINRDNQTDITAPLVYARQHPKVSHGN